MPKNILSFIFIGFTLFGLVFLSNSRLIENSGILASHDMKTPEQENGPQNAAGTTTLLFLDQLNYTHIERGDSVNMSGYVKWFNQSAPLLGFQNTSGIKVYPIIDNIHFDGLNGHDNLTQISATGGRFSFIIDVPQNYDITMNMTLWTNVTQEVDRNIYVSPTTLQSPQHNLDVIATTFFETLAINTAANDVLLVGETFLLNYRLYDDNNDPVNSSLITVFKNNNVTLNISNPVQPDGNGFGQLSITMQPGMHHIGLYFPGVNETTGDNTTYFQLAPINQSLALPRVVSIEGTYSVENLKNSSSTEAYTDEMIQLTGALWANGDVNKVLKNRAIAINMYNASYYALVATSTTDANGEYSVTIDLSTIANMGNGTLR